MSPTLSPTLLTALESRGLLHDATPGLAARLSAGPITGYVGFDPTADSLHVGSLVPVMGLVWLQRTGGRPIALVGGGTGLVGDPSGKRSERPMLDRAQVEANAAAIGRQLERFLDFESPGRGGARLLNNLTWLEPLRLLDFLREVGKHFTVNYMLQKESVKSRMEGGISFTEFSYMLVQALDFAHLHREAGCELQIGGSDQWGNITAGIELIGRQTGQAAHGVVMPLLTAATGAKFGKSEGENVWLDPARTSPYRFHQFWLNQGDADVERMLTTFTVLPLERIAEVMAAHLAAPDRRAAQRALADDITRRVHGEETTARVVAAGRVLFGGEDLLGADAPTLALVAREVTTIQVPRSRLQAGLGVVDALIETGLASSKADARRGIQGGGYSVNDERVMAVERALGEADLVAGTYVVLRKGRRAVAMLEAR